MSKLLKLAFPRHVRWSTTKLDRQLSTPYLIHHSNIKLHQRKQPTIQLHLNMFSNDFIFIFCALTFLTHFNKKVSLRESPWGMKKMILKSSISCKQKNSLIQKCLYVWEFKILFGCKLKSLYVRPFSNAFSCLGIF